MTTESDRLLNELPPVEKVLDETYGDGTISDDAIASDSEIEELKANLPELTPTEALFGFVAWLTTRPQAVTFSAFHNAAPGAELLEQFIARHNLPPKCRDGWEKLLVPEKSD